MSPIFERGGADAGDAAEVAQQVLPRLLADAWDVVELRAQRRFAALALVKRDREAVRLVA